MVKKLKTGGGGVNICEGEKAQVERAVHLHLTLFNYVNIRDFTDHTGFCPTCIAKVFAYLLLRGTIKEVHRGVFTYSIPKGLSARELLVYYSYNEEEFATPKEVEKKAEELKEIVKKLRKERQKGGIR